MKNLNKISILLLFSTLLLSFNQSQVPAVPNDGWKYSADLDKIGKIVDITVRGDTAYALVTSLGNNLVHISYNAGITWDTLVESGSYNPSVGGKYINARSLSFDTDTTFFVWGMDNMLVFQYYNGQKEFEDLFIAEKPPINDMAILGNKMYAEGSYHYFISNDAWKTIDTIDKYGGHDQMTFLNDSILEGAIYKSSEKTEYFAHINLNTGQWDSISFLQRGGHQFRDIKKINDNLIYASSSELTGLGEQQYDIMYRSRDGGRTWELILRSLSQPWFGIRTFAFRDEMNGYAVANWGKMLMTRDGGENWIQMDFSDVYHVKNKAGTNPCRSVAWVGDIPVFPTLQSTVYRYEGDFFDLDYKKITAADLWTPEDQTVETDGSIKFSWERKENNDVEYYHLQVTDNREYNRWLKPVFETKTENNSHTIPNLKKDKRYFWRVLTVKGSQIRESEVRSFTVGNVPPLAEPQLLQENCGIKQSGTSYEISWQQNLDAVTYEIEHWNDADTTHRDTIETEKFTCSFTELLNGVNHYFRVRSVNEIEKSEWSEVCNVGIRAWQPRVEEYYCALEEIDDGDKLKWEANKCHDCFYRLIFSKDENMSVFEHIEEIKGTEYTIAGIENADWLRPSTQYYWTVGAIPTGDPSLSSTFTDVCTFTTSPMLSVDDKAPQAYTVFIQDDIITIKSAHSINTLQLFDLSGREVAQSQSTNLSIQNLTPGIYFLLVNGEEMVKVSVN